MANTVIESQGVGIPSNHTATISSTDDNLKRRMLFGVSGYQWFVLFAAWLGWVSSVADVEVQ